MSEIEQSLIYRQQLISDLITLGADIKAILELKPTTTALEGLVVGIIKLEIMRGRIE